jgi:serine/threonine-protein kinase
MSPEQAKDLLVDARTDVFSFGVLLYEMLTGTKTFQGETTIDVIAAILNKEPWPIRQSLPEVPAEVERIINKSLGTLSRETFLARQSLV